jgi:hypothetical protein
VFTAHGHLGSAVGYDAGFRPALVAAAALSLGGALAALVIPARRRVAAAAPVAVNA